MMRPSLHPGPSGARPRAGSRRAAQSWSTRSFLRTFPVALRGSSSRKTISRGILYRARFFFTQPLSSSYIIDKDGTVRWSVHNADPEGRDLDAHLAELTALV